MNNPMNFSNRFFMTMVVWLISAVFSYAESPNIVFIFSDDQGYGDLGCYGSETISTPNIDSLAKEGMKFTSFYVHNRCSPSRAAFMTGCIAGRVGIDNVVYRRDKVGLHADEITVAELLKDKGYSTGLIGKWHLGDWPQFHPRKHGFDYFYGFLEHDDRKFGIYENEQLLEPDVSKTDGIHSSKLLKNAIEFLREQHNKPFFLMYSSPLPHTKWKPLDRFKGLSKQGTYGDVVQELDWQVGELLKELDMLGLAKNTLVVFASDNGPQLNVDNPGTAAPFRDGKWSNFEGGIRVPCIMRWPGKIAAASTCHEITAITDMLSTFCKLADIAVPTDRAIDGKSILPYMLGESQDEPIHDTWIIPDKTIRKGEWKLYVSKGKPGGVRVKNKTTSKRQPVNPGTLFNLRRDPGETTNVASQNSEVVKDLRRNMKEFMNSYRRKLRSNGRLGDR